MAGALFTIGYEEVEVAVLVGRIEALGLKWSNSDGN